MGSSIDIAGRAVGGGAPCFLIAEVAQTHDGSLGQAHAFVDAAAEAGADAIKFQTHIAEAESTRDEQFRINFSVQDDSRYDYWKRMEFTPEQWQGLSAHAAKRGLVFLSSAFSHAAIDLLEKIGQPAWKVGSGEFRTHDLINRMMATGKPILLSTGMSTWAEIATAVETFRESRADFALFQCTSQYPVSLDSVGLNVLDELRRRFACPVGLSDHSGVPYPVQAAIARGADLVEFHVTFDRRMFGPDVVASLTFGELSLVAAMRDACATMLSNPVDKDSMALRLDGLRTMFSKSLAPAHSVTAGTILTREMLTAKKPGSGIPPDQIDRVVGRVLARDITPDYLIRWSDLDGGDNA